MYPIEILRTLRNFGEEVNPRGQKVKELCRLSTDISYPFTSYNARKMNLDYIRREFQWYLNADPMDDRICKYAKLWKIIQQDDGRILSNYGQYWFGDQGGYHKVIKSLIDDPDSRQAYIPMLGRQHMFEGNKDVVCTKGIQFLIRNSRLDMYVDMRSQDAIFGMTNDLPTFWWLWEMVALEIGVQRGKFHHNVTSFHVYERHYGMLDGIVNEGDSGFYLVDYPPITDTEDLLSGKFKSPFGQWLMESPL